MLDSEIWRCQRKPIKDNVAEKTLIQQTRAIRENSTGLAGGSPPGFDFSVDVFKDGAVVEDFSELADGKSGGPFPDVKAKINLRRLDGNNEFVGAGCALHLRHHLRKIFGGSEGNRNSICKLISFLPKSFVQTGKLSAAVRTAPGLSTRTQD